MLENIKNKRVFKIPESMLDIPKMRFSSIVEGLKSNMTEINMSYRERFAKVNSKLIALNPMSVLSRGYGAIYNENNEIVKSSKSVKNGDRVKVKLFDGDFNATVTEGE